MILIDEFRIRVSIASNTFRRNLADILIKLASKFDQEVVKNAVIGLKIGCSIQKYIPKDNQWHHFAMTIDCYVKRNKNNKKKKRVSKKIFIDGNLTREENK
jgi:hypothetical protein